MEKLVVFPLNNDTEILIKGLKEKQIISGGCGIQLYRR